MTTDTGANMDPLTIAAVCLLVGLLGGGAGFAVGGAKANARAEEARTEALGTVADTVAAARAEEQARVDALTARLEAVATPYCDPDGEVYNEAACLVDRVCSQSGVTQDGGDATGCERVVNAWLSEREIAVVEADGADEALREERRNVYTRRK